MLEVPNDELTAVRQLVKNHEAAIELAVPLVADENAVKRYEANKPKIQERQNRLKVGIRTRAMLLNWIIYFLKVS